MLILAATPPAPGPPVGLAATPLLIWVLILILFLLLILLLYYWYLKLLGPTNKIGINNVVFTSATPATLPAGSPLRFAVTVKAFGYSDDSTPRNFEVDLFDKDSWYNPDDHLGHYSSGGGAGINPQPMYNALGAPTPLYYWEVEHTFYLKCNGACEVEEPGKASSGEANPELYARFRILMNWPHPELESAISRPVTCVQEGN